MTIRIASAVIIRVVDGDTVHTDLDIGWGVTLGPRIGKEPNFGTLRICRADGSAYDAPESSTNAGKQAAQFAKGLVVPGEKVGVISYGLATDGRRTLAAVATAHGDWAEIMTAAGFAKVTSS